MHEGRASKSVSGGQEKLKDIEQSLDEGTSERDQSLESPCGSGVCPP